MTRREERIRRLRREADHRSGGEKPMVYTPEMRTQVRAKAVEVYKQNLTEWVERGAVLTETDGGRVRAEFVIGGGGYSPLPPLPQAYFADAGAEREGGWARRT